MQCRLKHTNVFASGLNQDGIDVFKSRYKNNADTLLRRYIPQSPFPNMCLPRTTFPGLVKKKIFAFYVECEYNCLLLLLNLNMKYTSA